MLKRVNAVLSAAMIVLFCLHGLGNSFELFGAGSVVPSALSYALLVVVALHAAIGIALTLSTFAQQKRSGRAYWRLNRRFWAVRFSGLAIVVLVVLHLVIFAQVSGDVFRLRYFGATQLAGSLLLVAAVAVHVLANLQPLMISLGMPAPRGRAADIAVVMAAALAVTALAFIVYFIRWGVI